jgi:hypothetical protein
MLLVATVAGCASGSRAYRDKQMEFGAIRTVAVLPLQNLTKEGVASDRVRESFSTALLASGAVYVVPVGEVARTVSRLGMGAPASPTVEDITKLGKALQADAIITGVVREYGETRSGSASASVVAVSLQLSETQTGKVVWSAAATRGGVTLPIRLFGGGGATVNELTEEVIDALLDNLLK